MTDVKVEQCDRVLGLHFIPRNSIAGQDREGVLAGKYDDAQAIVLVARHRQAAEKAQQERDIRLLQARIAIYRGKIVGRNEEADDMRRFAIEALEYLEYDIRSHSHDDV